MTAFVCKVEYNPGWIYYYIYIIIIFNFSSDLKILKYFLDLSVSWSLGKVSAVPND